MIVKQLTDHEQEVSERFEQQIVSKYPSDQHYSVELISGNCYQESRESRYIAVRSLLEDNIKLRERSETRFQTYFEKEVSRLRNEYFKEAEVLTLLLSYLS